MYIRKTYACVWGPANPLFVNDKCVTATMEWLHAGYVQKTEARTANRGTIEKDGDDRC